MGEVVRPAGLGTNNLEDDLPEQAAKNLGRLHRPALQQLLQLGDLPGDPLLRGNLESRTCPGTKSIKLCLKPSDALLGGGKLLRNSYTVNRLPTSDEIDQIGHTLLSIGKLSRLAAAHVSDVTGELGELVPDATKSMADGPRLEKPVADSCEENPLGYRPLDGQPVLAEMTRRSSSALISFSFRWGRTTRVSPLRRAASTLAWTRATGSTWPESVIPPVMAKSPRTGRPVNADTSAATIATPADAPSFHSTSA